MRVAYQLLEEIAASCGLGLVGGQEIASAQSFLAGERQRLLFWQEEGLAGEMSYMKRPDSLFCDLKGFLPEACSVVSFVVPYQFRFEDGEPGLSPGFGRVARYAWGRDYHRVLRRRLKKFVDLIQAELALDGDLKWRFFSDAVPLLERGLARSCSQGFIGKNTMLIRPGWGSFTFLAEILWDLEVTGLQSEGPIKNASCGVCTRCLDECPTAAFTKAKVLDARKCISYLTIEKRTAFSEWESQAIGEWIFGCDICQEVCPFNHRGVENSVIKEFKTESGAGSVLSLEEILSIRSEGDYLERFAGTALMRSGRVGLLRNACAVAANTHCFWLEDKIYECTNDSSSIIRLEAQRSLRRLKTTFPEELADVNYLAKERL